MDDLIFEEFKGTGNMELVLERFPTGDLPAADISQSGTRKNCCSLPRRCTASPCRRTLVQMKPVEAMEAQVKQLGKSKSNAEFLDRMASK